MSHPAESSWFLTKLLNERMTMSNYEVDYSKLEGQAKLDRALEDIQDWMGKDRFEKITDEFKRFPNMSFDQFSMYVSMAGVQGYPVKAWWEKIFGEPPRVPGEAPTSTNFARETNRAEVI